MAPCSAPSARLPRVRCRRPLALLVTLLALAACGREARRAPMFQLLTPDETGVTFANTITTNDSVNVQTDVYVYNGAGVAIGDIDDDGLPDLFFTGNMVSSRLYRNLGGMRFEDITEQAGVTTTRWATGATMVDIDGDGWLDIYVSVSGPEWTAPAERANLLFVNNGDGTFTEAAARYGIADTGFTTHAVFLDYDRDGCLDLFLLTNSPRDFSRSEITRNPSGVRADTPGSYNQLYRSDCRGSFINVSDEAGILRTPGYGLGVVVSDLNRDGWPDIYISNDGAPNDVLYVNNRDGTFTDRAGRWLKHASYAGMGVDIADLDDDGWPDILQVDMMPSALRDRKRMSGFMTYGSLMESRSRGLRDDYGINTLQLSNGVTPDGDVIFSEIARMAGVAYTEWSWSALFADFDNDGRKDIVITNGYPKAVNDFDYQTAILGVRRGSGADGSPRAGLEILDSLHAYETANFIFRNTGDLTFRDETVAWGMDQPGFSYGTAYADLDNDGRLDLVVSNIDAPAFIYHNTGRGEAPSHWLQVRLDGESPNRRGVGATLTLTAGGRTQHLYSTPYRGYMSTVDDRLHFGLGSASRVDTLEVRWPDGRRQLLTDLDADRLIVVRQADAADHAAPARRPEPGTLPFQPVDAGRALPYVHERGGAVDFGVQPLLPYQISRQGPPIAVGDVNGDGLDDVFVGGGLGVAGQLFLQQRDGRFTASTEGQPWAADRAYEDWGALFFDANGNGLPDLYVASGGYHLAPGSPLLQDRLYINHGGGRFVRDPRALPAMPTSTATVRAGDFDGDGRLDLFVGGRLTPRAYPYPARSHILRNEGGRFTDVTAEVAPELIDPGGMITDAVWIDFDGDGRLDLVTAGEWMPLRFHRNDGQRFRDATRATRLPPMRGWWFSLAAGDIDGDGRPDLIAGNLGLNHGYTTSPDSQFGIRAADFTGNQTTDIVLTREIDGVEYPFHGLAPLGREIYSLALRFPSYRAFADAPIDRLFSPAQLQEALHYRADTFASVLLRNEGGGAFSAVALPALAQIAPIRGILVHDVDGDGHLDLIVAGNLYDTEPNTPPADAGNGLWLRGEGQGRLTPVRPTHSGFLAPGNVSGLALIETPEGRSVLVANTGAALQLFSIGGERQALRLTTPGSATAGSRSPPGSARSGSRGSERADGGARTAARPRDTAAASARPPGTR